MESERKKEVKFAIGACMLFTPFFLGFLWIIFKAITFAMDGKYLLLGILCLSIFFIVGSILCNDNE